MVKKTGNIILLLFYTCVLGAVNNQSLQVNLLDMQGNAINQVEVGVPFLLQVKVNNIDHQDQPQGFDAWDDFAVSFYGQSNSMQMVNGKTTRLTTFTHVVTANKKGQFTCSPLHITDTSGTDFFSDVIKINVGDGIQLTQNRSQQPYVLTVDFDNRVVYLGQKVSVLLRFGYQQEFNNLQITQSPFQYFHQGFVAQQATSGSFKIGQEEYQSQDFLMELYPEKVGTLLIPAFQASFVPERQNISHMFALMMGGGTVIQSQPRSLEVQSLPVSVEHPGVSAIGHFDKMEFTISSQQGKVGEGLVAKMVVVGDGNLEVVKTPMLELPQGLHYYEGNSNITRNSQGVFRKEFEWIVQAEFSSEFAIPEQKFVYFDLKTASYKTLKSNAQKIVISGGPLAIKQEKVSDGEQMQHEQIQTQKSKTNKEVNKQETMNKQSFFDFSFLQNSLNSQILTWGIQLLICLIGLLLVFIFTKKYQHNWFFMQTFKLRLQFIQSCRNKDIHGVYKTFEMLMQQYELEMNSLGLQEYFIELKLPDESFDNWKNFLTMIWEMNFAKDRASDQTDLAFSLAKQWFVIILSCCKLHRKKHTQKQIIS